MTLLTGTVYAEDASFTPAPEATAPGAEDPYKNVPRTIPKPRPNQLIQMKALRAVQLRLEQEIVLPEGIAEEVKKTLFARVELQFDARGALSDWKWSSESPNETFNAALEATLNRYKTSRESILTAHVDEVQKKWIKVRVDAAPLKTAAKKPTSKAAPLDKVKPQRLKRPTVLPPKTDEATPKKKTSAP